MKYLVGIVLGFAALWIVLVAVVVVARPKGMSAADAAGLMPDLVRLVRGLAGDRALPRRVRARVWFLLLWMASPIDAIPDVIPVIGLADDVILTYLVLRSVVRAASEDVLERHWPGTPEGLAVIERLLARRY